MKNECNALLVVLSFCLMYWWHLLFQYVKLHPQPATIPIQTNQQKKTNTYGVVWLNASLWQGRPLLLLALLYKKIYHDALVSATFLTCTKAIMSCLLSRTHNQNKMIDNWLMTDWGKRPMNKRHLAFRPLSSWLSSWKRKNTVYLDFLYFSCPY